MLLGLQHAGDREGCKLRGRIIDAFHVEPDERQLLRQLRERRRGVEVILEPGEGDLHR
jgi:hypothetical protein